jgi:hypothetical protein
MTLGSGDWTIEFWVLTPLATGTYGLYDQRTNISTARPFIILTNRTITYGVGGSTVITSPQVINDNTWHHISIVKISNNTRLYIDGVQQGSTYADTQTYTGEAGRPVIGSLGNLQYIETYQNRNSLRGFMSNIRVCRGVGVYTGAFTVPTSPLTATQSAGTNIAAITGTQCVLLLNGTNNYLADSSNSPKALCVNSQTARPIGGQVRINPYSGSGKYGSHWFDDTFAYIDCLRDSSFTLSGDATIEFWVYPTTTGTIRTIIQQLQPSTNTNSAWQARLTTGNNLQFIMYNGSTAYTATSTSTVSPNTWTHCAITKVGSTVTLYISGVSGGSTTLIGSTNTSTFPLRIGGDMLTTLATNYTGGLANSSGGQVTNKLIGYLTGVRIVNGTAVYTGNFAVPNIQPVEVDGAGSVASYSSTTNVNTTFAASQTALLLKFDRWGLADYTATPQNAIYSYGITTTASPAKYDRAITRNTANGLTSQIYIAGNCMTWGTNPFTISTWLYVANWTNGVNLLNFGFPGGPGGPSTLFGSFNITSAGVIRLDRPGSGATTLASISTATYTNTWFYITIVVSGSTARTYINGILANTASVSIINYTLFGGQIGAYSYDGNGVIAFGNVYFDDFFVAKSAVWTANFTPPQQKTVDPINIPTTITNNTYGVYQNY